MQDYEQPKLWHLKLWFITPHCKKKQCETWRSNFRQRLPPPQAFQSKIPIIKRHELTRFRKLNCKYTTGLNIQTTLFTCWSPAAAAAVGVIRCNYLCLSPSTVCLFLGLLVSIDALKWFIPAMEFTWMEQTSQSDISLSCCVSSGIRSAASPNMINSCFAASYKRWINGQIEPVLIHRSK